MPNFSKKILFLVLSSSLAMTPLAVYSADNLSDMNSRLERLERMANNPILLRLSQRLSNQQREISKLYDEIDRLKYTLKKHRIKSELQYKDTDERLTKLNESVKTDKPLPISLEPVSLPIVSVPVIVAEPVPVLPVGEGVIEADVVELKVEPKVEPDVKVDKASDAVVPVIQANGPNVAHKIEAETIAIVKPDPVNVRPATLAEKKVYKSAFDLMKLKKYDEAIKAFEGFRAAYPESVLSSNTAYWAGEGYLVLGQLESAKASFSVVMDLYPDTSKASAALLRAADTCRKLGQTDEAIANYQLLVSKYPKSSRFIKKAKARLKAMGQ